MWNNQGRTMTRAELLTNINDILQSFRDPSDAGRDDVTATIEAFNAEMQRIRDALDNLKTQLIEKHERQLIAVFYVAIIDARVSDVEFLVMLLEYAETLLQEIPTLRMHLAALREIPRKLLKFTLESPGSALKRYISTYSPHGHEVLIDQLTNAVMELPVSYYVNGVMHTINLFSLLNLADETIGIRCPYTRHIIFLSDLIPCKDLIAMHEKGMTSAHTLETDDYEEELSIGLDYIQCDDLQGLMQWYDGHRLLLGRCFVKDGVNTSLLHLACQFQRFEIAAWIIEQDINYLYRDSQQTKCFALIELNKLEDAVKASPENAGLHFLLACTHAHHSKNNEEYQTLAQPHLEIAAQEKYIPAEIRYNYLMCHTGQAGAATQAAANLRVFLRKGHTQAFIFMNMVYVDFQKRNNATMEGAINSTKLYSPVSAQHLISDGLALLASSEAEIDRGWIEYTVANLLHEQAKDQQKQTGYKLFKAFLLAKAADEKGYAQARTLLEDICNTIGIMNKVATIGWELTQFQKDRALSSQFEKAAASTIEKPWVPYAPSYAMF